MREIILTDPFTGIDFQAVQFDDHSIVATHPLTGEKIMMRYAPDSKCFMLEAKVYERIYALTISDAAQESKVSVQRISAACKSGKLPFKTLPNGSKMILKSDLDAYNETKKVGRPRKDDAR